MDDATLVEREHASLAGWYRAIGTHARGARLLEPVPGVQATIVPARPDRSLFNAVVYRDGSALLDTRDVLAEAYRQAGVRAWTVWTRPGDVDVARALADAGHALDGEPTMMGAPLDELDLEPRAELDLVADAGPELAARINDLAHDEDHGVLGFAEVFDGFGDPTWHTLVARADGEPAATVGWREQDGDCSILFVATVPAARGRGLCPELMRLALRQGIEAGCTTTTLEATPMGRPVYERLGYRALGTLAMWELRQPVTAL